MEDTVKRIKENVLLLILKKKNRRQWKRPEEYTYLGSFDPRELQ